VGCQSSSLSSQTFGSRDKPRRLRLGYLTQPPSPHRGVGWSVWLSYGFDRHDHEDAKEEVTCNAQVQSDALGLIYQDVEFAHLFPERGRAAEAPWRLALVTILQAIENLSDRQAAEMVRVRLDWKYALSLPLDDEGFDASSQMDFRQRLVEHHAEDLLLEAILRVCREQGLLKKFKLMGEVSDGDSLRLPSLVALIRCNKRSSSLLCNGLK
jgi:transposase